ncbi:MAG: hypothetical protein EOM50_17510 [Erysipelotrichia bacterium]|nr:hypothetical protein [Erysipelotrichia bacterium]
MIKQELKKAVERQAVNNKVKNKQVSVRATTNELEEIESFCDYITLSKSALLTLAIDTMFIGNKKGIASLHEHVDYIDIECKDAIHALINERKSKRSTNKNEFIVIRVDDKHFEQLKLITEKMQMSKSNVIMALLLMVVKTKNTK